MSDLNKIGQNEQGMDQPVPEDKLIAYLEGRLDPEEQREIEELLSEEGMMSDALEGLQQLNIPDAQERVNKINYKLQKQLGKKRPGRRKPVIQNRWIVLAIVLVLLLVVLGFWVIKLSR